MSYFEYAAIFIGIIVGLALANILASVHKLMEAGPRVRWDWLAPAMAANAILLTLGFFWHQWLLMQTAPHTARYFISVLVRAIAFFLLYLACAATLPDDVPEGGLDLCAYYFANRVRIWGLFCATFVLSLSTWAVGFAETRSMEHLQANAATILMSVVGLLLGIASLTVSAVWWHRIAVIALAILFLTVFGPMVLP
ncbi:MAG TPA: hypothetical protein VGG10_23000 [Rhizomicrobium sp.]|jgi:hypothetical protein